MENEQKVKFKRGKPSPNSSPAYSTPFPCLRPSASGVGRSYVTLSVVSGDDHSSNHLVNDDFDVGVIAGDLAEDDRTDAVVHTNFSTGWGGGTEPVWVP